MALHSNDKHPGAQAGPEDRHIGSALQVGSWAQLTAFLRSWQSHPQPIIVHIPNITH